MKNRAYWTCQILGWSSYAVLSLWMQSQQVGWTAGLIAAHVLYVLYSIALTHPELERFTDRYGELFEEDARAQLWVGEIDGVGMLVLDEHDLIYAYGPLHRFEQVLRERGYTSGDPQVPNPHEHRYSQQYDQLEQDLRRLWAWNQILPLDQVPED